MKEIDTIVMAESAREIKPQWKEMVVVTDLVDMNIDSEFRHYLVNLNRNYLQREGKIRRLMKWVYYHIVRLGKSEIESRDRELYFRNKDIAEYCLMLDPDKAIYLSDLYRYRNQKYHIDENVKLSDVNDLLRIETKINDLIASGYGCECWAENSGTTIEIRTHFVASCRNGDRKELVDYISNISPYYMSRVIDSVLEAIANREGEQSAIIKKALGEEVRVKYI